ncbi:hypothetical protein AB0B85_10570 [Micromonospora sp. NPDC049044]
MGSYLRCVGRVGAGRAYSMVAATRSAVAAAFATTPTAYHRAFTP